MLPFRPPQDREAAAAVLTTLTDAAWVLAALVDVLGRGPLDRYPGDDPAARLLAAAGLLEEADGGYRLTPGMASLSEITTTATTDVARSVIGQVASVTKAGSTGRRWIDQDDETLFAQGRASGAFARPLLGLLCEVLPGLGDRLQGPGAAFLDVGVGVGAVACAAAEVFPTLSVVGIDPHERVLRLASRSVAERGVGERVTLRPCGMEDLDDQEAFDMAWVPAPYIPPPAFAEGLPKVYRSLRVGGWVVVGLGRPVDSGVSAEVSRWQIALTGGTAMSIAEAEAALSRCGFSAVAPLSAAPGAPLLVVGRRQ